MGDLACPPCRVLLVSTNSETDPHPVYPLGLDYLRASLLTQGHEVRILDVNLSAPGVPELESFVCHFAPDFIGVSIRNVDNTDSTAPKSYLPEAMALIGRIRAVQSVPVIVGGSGFSIFPTRILEWMKADYGIVGPGEESLCALVAGLKNGRVEESLPGLVYRRKGMFVMNPPARGFRGVGKVARDPVLVKGYWERGGSLNIQLKRGCPHNCIYCTYPSLEGRHLLEADARVAVDDIQRLYEEHGVDSFFVVDSVFNLVPRQADSFAMELIRRRLPVRWTAFFMPKGITSEQAMIWKESGLEGVELGVDTIAEPLLRRWGKPFSVEDVLESARVLARADLPYVMYLLFGGPGETRATFEETVSHATACPRAVVFAFFGMRIYPNSPLHSMAIEDGMVSDADDLIEPCFYMSKTLDADWLQIRRNELGRQTNWMIAGRNMDALKQMAGMLRRSGHKGSLWQKVRPGETGDGSSKKT